MRPPRVFLLAVGAAATAIAISCTRVVVAGPRADTSTFFEILPHGISIGMPADKLQSERHIDSAWLSAEGKISNEDLVKEELRDHRFFKRALYAIEHGRLAQVALDVDVPADKAQCYRQFLLISAKRQWGAPGRRFVAKEGVGLFPRDHLVYEWNDKTLKKDIVIFLSSYRRGEMSLVANVRNASSSAGKKERTSKALSPEDIGRLERDVGLDENSLLKAKLECAR